MTWSAPQGPNQSPYPSWLSKSMPWIGTGLQAGGQLIGAQAAASALRTNAATYQTEGRIAAVQAQEQEMQQRRMGTKAIGEQVAAAGQSGGGYGGSTGRLIAQSAVNTELDALNIRYKGLMQQWAYGQQAQNLRSEARTTSAAGYLKAGSALLRGYSGNYTGNPSYVTSW